MREDTFYNILTSTYKDYFNSLILSEDMFIIWENSLNSINFTSINKVEVLLNTKYPNKSIEFGE